jgi:hypothetical protein
VLGEFDRAGLIQSQLQFNNLFEGGLSEFGNSIMVADNHIGACRYDITTTAMLRGVVQTGTGVVSTGWHRRGHRYTISTEADQQFKGDKGMSGKGDSI